MHFAGYLHNDLKADQVALDISDNGVEVTLLDLGNMTRIGSRPYEHHKRMGKKELENIRLMCCHMAPEAVCGNPVTIASDIFSFGDLVQFCDLEVNSKVMSHLVALAAKEDP